jgi:hypothetical protein
MGDCGGVLVGESRSIGERLRSRLDGWRITTGRTRNSETIQLTSSIFSGVTKFILSGLGGGGDGGSTWTATEVYVGLEYGVNMVGTGDGAKKVQMDLVPKAKERRI